MTEYVLRPNHFRVITHLMREVAGISLPAGKEGLVLSRVGMRLRALGLDTFDEYLELLAGDAGAGELSNMVDALIITKTAFFREIEHFRFVQRVVLPAVIDRAEGLRIWSAGCSTGEEPYTIAMILREALPECVANRACVLASDVSVRALRQAGLGEYGDDAMGDVPEWYQSRYFVPTAQSTARIADSVRRLIRFAELNLVSEWPQEAPFDVIFCRNVMIYLDQDAQERLVERLAHALRPGGFLFIGHAETLSGIPHTLRYIQPAVYIK